MFIGPYKHGIANKKYIYQLKLPDKSKINVIKGNFIGKLLKY